MMRRVTIAAQPAVDADRLERMRDAGTGLVKRGFGRIWVDAGRRSFVKEREEGNGDRTDWNWFRRKAQGFLGSSEIVDRLAVLEDDSLAFALTCSAE